MLDHSRACALLFRYECNKSAKSTTALVSVTSMHDDGPTSSQHLEADPQGDLEIDKHAVRKE